MENQVRLIQKKVNAYLNENEDSESYLQHLISLKSLLSYQRIASIVSDELPQKSTILDWGCLYGQMGTLLEQDFEVNYHDVFDAHGIDPLGVSLKKEISDPREALPYQDNTFDAVLSCGVLEHISDYRGKSSNKNLTYDTFLSDAQHPLGEIHRILKPGGFFFVYNFPNFYSYSENLNELRGHKSHYVRFTKKRIQELFQPHFEMVHIQRYGIVPNTLSGFPDLVRKPYQKYAQQIAGIDDIFSKFPFVNVLCESYEIHLRKIEK